MTAPTPDLDAIRGRATDATPGPWWTVGETMFARDVYAGSGSGDDPLIATDTRTEADSTFIAHAREDIPALLDALAAVTAERDQARQVLADAPHDNGCECTYVKSDNEWVEVVPCSCWKAGL